MSPQVAAPSGPPRFKRSARNYLLDRHFQLKYTGYLVGLTLVISVGLGAMLYRESSRSVELGDAAVAIGAEANSAGKDAVDQSRSLTTVIEGFAESNYKNDPTMLAMMKADDKAKNDEILGRASLIASTEARLKDQREALARQRRELVVVLTGALTLLVLLVGLAGIVVTHKVAGPVYKMKRLLAEVGEGRLLVPPGRLRKGDELQDFFDVFASMVEKLRARQSEEIAMLDRAIDDAKSSDPHGEVTSKLVALRAHMQGELDRS